MVKQNSTASFPKDTCDICGVKINNITSKQAIGIIDQLVRKGENSIVVTPNVDHVVRYQKVKEFREIYGDASLVLADGMPLIWASHFLKNPIKEKISGSDIFPRICELANNRGYKIFLLGGRPGAAAQAASKLKENYADLNIAGVYSPPFGFENDKEENEKIINHILTAKPDILFVGLGSPKQEKWICDNRNIINVPVSMGVGVTFELYSGMVKRAPVWMQKAGLEWLWRLMMEPRRLWRRYLVEDMSFFTMVLKHKIQLLRLKGERNI